MDLSVKSLNSFFLFDSLEPSGPESVDSFLLEAMASVFYIPISTKHKGVP